MIHNDTHTHSTHIHTYTHAALGQQVLSCTIHMMHNDIHTLHTTHYTLDTHTHYTHTRIRTYAHTCPGGARSSHLVVPYFATAFGSAPFPHLISSHFTSHHLTSLNLSHLCHQPTTTHHAAPRSLSVLKQLDLVFMRPKVVVVRVGPRSHGGFGQKPSSKWDDRLVQVRERQMGGG